MVVFFRLKFIFKKGGVIGFGLFSKNVVENLHDVEFVGNSPFQVVAPKGRLRTPEFPGYSQETP